MSHPSPKPDDDRARRNDDRARRNSAPEMSLKREVQIREAVAQNATLAALWLQLFDDADP